MFSFADPLWPSIEVKVIETSMSIYAMHKPTVVPSVNVIAKIMSERWLLITCKTFVKFEMQL